MNPLKTYLFRYYYKLVEIVTNITGHKAVLLIPIQLFTKVIFIFNISHLIFSDLPPLMVPTRKY